MSPPRRAAIRAASTEWSVVCPPRIARSSGRCRFSSVGIEPLCARFSGLWPSKAIRPVTIDLIEHRGESNDRLVRKPGIIDDDSKRDAVVLHRANFVTVGQGFEYSAPVLVAIEELQPNLAPVQRRPLPLRNSLGPILRESAAEPALLHKANTPRATRTATERRMPMPPPMRQTSGGASRRVVSERPVGVPPGSDRSI